MSNKSNNFLQSEFSKILKFMKCYKYMIFINALLSVGVAILNLVPSYYMNKLLNYALAKNTSGVVNIIIIMVCTIVFGSPVIFFNKYLMEKIGADLIYDLRKAIVEHMTTLSLKEAQASNSGDTISRFSNDIIVIQNFLNNEFMNILYLPLLFIGASCYLFYINYKMFLLSILIMPFGVYMTRILTKPLSRYMGKMQQSLGSVNLILQDILGGIYIIKAFNLHKIFEKKFKNQVTNTLSKNLSLEKQRSLILPVTVILQVVPLILCIIYGGYLTLKKQMTPGDLLAITSLLYYLVLPIAMFPNVIADIRMCNQSFKRIFEVLDRESERTSGEIFDSEDVENIIECKDLSFAYENNNINIINDFNCVIKRGKKVALVGYSGSGKSTILKLISTIYEPKSGDIKIYGNSLGKLNLSYIRSKIAVVSQESFLFPTTIEDNIRIGKESATHEQIVNAAKMAKAHEFIMKLPEDYKTRIGERGLNLSGGQRQLISIARAILKDAQILIMDEPTASLDSQSEFLVQEALANIMENKTIIVAAHKLKTIEHADEVLVIDNGKVVERGSHNSLLKLNGLYSKLYNSQFSC
ncbi:ABC transporter ATP-binding protein [Clostridium felsineum]|uniref:ABC transporter ATP-binding protein n=1 Tax=Clostridium felsineum TaxID=36839 RepID=UPI00098C34D5|nr:ABC transporter ATP-binding protein [Clostridium felsineum]URZ17234.1 Putative multidrug export ATP-binding/permease protein [Clostridium felsineum DSM 794]